MIRYRSLGVKIGKVLAPALRLTEIMIAAAPGDEHSFEGRIDDVVVYDRALAGDEIRRHWRDPLTSPPAQASR